MKYNDIQNHILKDAVYEASPFFNLRPASVDIDLLVIHCISLPEGCYGKPFISDLFLGCLDCSFDPSFADLAGLEVSAHLLIKRDGSVSQYVPFDKRAWHAGVSHFDGRDGCNDFSIGIELEGTDSDVYTNQQYSSLHNITEVILQTYPKIKTDRIVAHSDIAPGRKTDPGSGFDWPRYLSAIK